MIKTITINTDTHCVVPKGMVYELPELPMPISKGEFSKDLFDGFQMHQYAMRYLDEAIAAAPQPEQVESEPFGYYENGRFSVITDGGPDKYRERKGYQGAIYTTPQPDRVAELEQLRQQVADLEKERDGWQDDALGSRITVETLRAERDAALNEARDFESDVDTIAQHNVDLQLEIITLKSALKVVSALLHEYKMGNAYKNKFVEEAITTIEGVLKHD